MCLLIIVLIIITDFCIDSARGHRVERWFVRPELGKTQRSCAPTQRSVAIAFRSLGVRFLDGVGLVGVNVKCGPVSTRSKSTLEISRCAGKRKVTSTIQGRKLFTILGIDSHDRPMACADLVYHPVRLRIVQVFLDNLESRGTR